MPLVIKIYVHKRGTCISAKNGCYGEGSPIAIRQHGAVFSQVSVTETDFDPDACL